MLTIAGTRIPLHETAIDDIEQLLSKPLNYPVLKLLELVHYSDLLTFFPWYNSFQMDVVMLMIVQAYSKVLTDVC